MNSFKERHAEKILQEFFPRVQPDGFTLIEILISLTIMAIVAVVIVNSLGSFAYRQQFQGEVNDVARSISEQRVRSVAAYGDTNYGVHVTPAEIAFYASGTPDYNPSKTATTTLVHSVASSDFSNGLSYISFSRITGVPSATGTIYLYNSQLDSTSTITVYDSGLIK